MSARRAAAATLTSAAVAFVAIAIAPMFSSAATPAHSATGTIANATVAGNSATDIAFTTSCPAMPANQGFDAYVFDLPAAAVQTGWRVDISGANAANNDDMAVYVYSDDCDYDRFENPTHTTDVSFALVGTDRYVVAFTLAGANVSVSLTVTPASPSPSVTGTPTASPSTTASPSPGAGAPRRTYPGTPDDPLYLAAADSGMLNSGQWGLRTIRASRAWQEQRATGAGVTVAVLDSGLDVGHPDFACTGKVHLATDSDFDPDGETIPYDDVSGHGTHVAGIIGACTHNGTGVAGVAPDSTLLPVQVVSPHNPDLNADVARGIDIAIANGAHVVNLSLSFGVNSYAGTTAYLTLDAYEAMRAAVVRAADAGVVLVAAAGNDTSPLCGFPAIAQHVVCVGSSDPRDVNSWYSNFPVKFEDGQQIGPALLAPGGTGIASAADCEAAADLGEEILSTYTRTLDATRDCDDFDGYAYLQGTSMAAPHVSGVAALVYDRIGAVRSAANRAKVIEALLQGAHNLYAPGYDPASGYGRVDAFGAVSYWPPATTASPSPSVSPSPSPTQVAQPTTVSLTSVPASTQYSDSVAMVARLTSRGSPVVNEPLTFQLWALHGFREVTAVTDSTGTARAVVVANLAPGSYDAVVGYSGKKDTWSSSSDRRPTVVTREDTVLSLVVSGTGSKRTLTATLADADDAASRVAGATIVFYADGAPVGQAVTDTNGVAVYVATPGARGNNTLWSTRFEGNDFYLASTATG